jgi:hypothetical protein
VVKPIAKIYSQEFHGNLFSIFLSLISFSMHFRILNEFLEFLLGKWKIRKSRKSMNNIGPLSVPRPIWPKAGACHGHRVDAPTGDHHTWRLDGGTSGIGGPADEAWGGSELEHEWPTGNLPGKFTGSGPHQCNRAAWGRQWRWRGGAFSATMELH